MYKKIIEQYIEEINHDFNLSKIIFEKLKTDDDEIINMINHSTIISMCIKYEAFTADLMLNLTKKPIKYNHPWSYTRNLSKMLKIEIIDEYKNAHDVWEYYNTLKHINHKNKITNLKISEEHKIKNSWDALKFAHDSLINLLTKLLS